jgi:hypothetical protein
MTAAQINELSTKRYGYDASEIGGNAALWLAQFILDTTGKNVMKKIMQIRNKAGKGTPFPEFGTELFNSY